jgi:signal transduction histidine kinase
MTSGAVALLTVEAFYLGHFDAMLAAVRLCLAVAVSIVAGLIVHRMVGQPLMQVVAHVDVNGDLGGAAEGVREATVDAPTEVQQLSRAVATLLDRAASRATDLEHRTLELVDTNTALNAERRKLLRLERQRQAADLVLDTAVRVLPKALIVVAPNQRIRVWNQGAEELFKVPANEAVGQDFIGRFVVPASADDVLLFGDGPDGNLRLEARANRGQGDQFTVDLTITPVHTPRGTYHAIIARDLEQSRALEAETRQAQKLEAVGRLASGVAHEINTPIQFVGDSIHFARDACQGLLDLVGVYRRATQRLPPEQLAELTAAEDAADLEYTVAELPRTFERTLDGVQRVATIVRSLKEFAHPEGGDKTVADVNRALASTLTVARNEVKYVADVETDFGDLPPVACHVGELNQVFLNLVVNAAHAIQDRGGKGNDDRGTIRIVTRAEEEHVTISISDDGCGIPEAIRSRVFDPFFTTKSVGRGTGQGLAVARNVIVDKHGGTLTFDSRLGQGTTFCIRLPVR